MARIPWYQYDITKEHGRDDGVDIGTPSDTPVSFPFDGRIIDAGWHVYGGQVVAAVPGTDYSEYEIHLDNIYVKPGDTVRAGEIIGTSGGGVNDKLVHNGAVVPAASQAWYQGHSTGPHTELGFFEGQTLAEFNQGWGNAARQLDPGPIISELRQGVAPQWPGPGIPQAATGALGGAANSVLTTLFPWLNSAPQAVHTRLLSIYVGVIGVSLIAWGSLFIYAAAKGETPITVIVNGVKTVAKAGEKTGETAAKVAAVAA